MSGITRDFVVQDDIWSCCVRNVMANWMCHRCVKIVHSDRVQLFSCNQDIYLSIQHESVQSMGYFKQCYT